MGYDRNDVWMTCGERDDKLAEHGLGIFDDPWSEISRVRAQNARLRAALSAMIVATEGARKVLENPD